MLQKIIAKSVILECGKLKQKDAEFTDRLSNIVRLCPKTTESQGERQREGCSSLALSEGF